MPDNMIITRYPSPLGELLLAADHIGLAGLWFEGQKNYPRNLRAYQEGTSPILQEVQNWLDLYFSGVQPDFTPPLHPSGTPFQLKVWGILAAIPYGQTLAYGDIAKKLGCRSAQAVGGAVGKNPISIIVPCHRVLGSQGQLTGYAGGLHRKAVLLQLERSVPTP